MKKRALWGAVSPFAIGLLLMPSAFATSLDYAKSIGQIEMGDTVNYVIEATSDGGYVVGGQTLQCLKYEDGGVEKGDGDNPGPEVVLFSECEEYYGGDVNKTSTTDYLIERFCGGGRGASGYYYSIICLDYMAKFKQDGTKEWLTLIDDDSKPVAVGETNTDYRLLTMTGSLYTFAKTDGAESISTQIDTYYVKDAIINNNGTILAYDDDGIELFGVNGQVTKSLEEEYDETSGTYYYIDNPPFAKPLVRTDNGFITFEIKESLKPETNSWTIDKVSIVEVSQDLQTVTPIMEITEADAIESGIEIYAVLSADRNGNVLLMAETLEPEADSGEYGIYLVTIDKDGEMVEMKPVEEVVTLPDDGQTDDEDPIILDDFTLVMPASRKLVHLSPNLEVSESYDLGEGEMISDVVVLKDGSLAGVGYSTASTANYTVDGGMNGTYLRLAAKGNTPSAINPNTFDDSGVLTLGAGAIVVVAAAGAAILYKRR